MSSHSLFPGVKFHSIGNIDARPPIDGDARSAVVQIVTMLTPIRIVARVHIAYVKQDSRKNISTLVFIGITLEYRHRNSSHHDYM